MASGMLFPTGINCDASNVYRAGYRARESATYLNCVKSLADFLIVSIKLRVVVIGIAQVPLYRVKTSSNHIKIPTALIGDYYIVRWVGMVPKYGRINMLCCVIAFTHQSSTPESNALSESIHIIIKPINGLNNVVVKSEIANSLR
jgi:hypothetical protein